MTYLELSNRSEVAAALQDAYHYALRLARDGASGFAGEDGTADYWSAKAFSAFEKAIRAGRLLDGRRIPPAYCPDLSAMGRAQLLKRIEMFAASCGVDAYGGTVNS